MVYTLILIVLVIIAVAVALAVLKNAPRAGSAASNQTTALPYTAIDRLLSPTELAFYRALQQAAGPHQLISSKVRLTDVLTCNAEAGKQGFRGKISQKHVDFVLFDPEDARIIAAIELDDSTHKRQQRQSRDTFLDDAFRAAKLPLHRFPAAAAYDPLSIKEKLTS